MILIIDDDSAIRSSLSFMLKRAKYDVQAVSGPKEAIETVRSVTPQLILMDMNFSLSTNGEEGLVLLRQVKLFCPDVPVILMTAWGSIPLAVQGMQAGAFDFITKPWNNAALMQRIETALELTAKDKTADAPVTDDDGLIAEAVHLNSPRRNKPFVKVNLGGISQTLFESEMFGHKKGAFTDAVTDRKGRFELADKGTIFLDEIGELDLSCQVKLLRVLQEQTFEPLGESRPRKVDVRVVCATNADLEQMVREHTFREDLFYRINLITVHPYLPRGPFLSHQPHYGASARLARTAGGYSPAGTSFCREPLPGRRAFSGGIDLRCLGVPEPPALSGKYPRTEEPGGAYLAGIR